MIRNRYLIHWTGDQIQIHWIERRWEDRFYDLKRWNSSYFDIKFISQCFVVVTIQIHATNIDLKRWKRRKNKLLSREIWSQLCMYLCICRHELGFENEIPMYMSGMRRKNRSNDFAHSVRIFSFSLHNLNGIFTVFTVYVSLIENSLKNSSNQGVD